VPQKKLSRLTTEDEKTGLLECIIQAHAGTCPAPLPRESRPGKWGRFRKVSVPRRWIVLDNLKITTIGGFSHFELRGSFARTCIPKNRILGCENLACIQRVTMAKSESLG
jgi:hypothetical protein